MNPTSRFTQRSLIQGTSAAALLSSNPPGVTCALAADKSKSFPDKFLWEAATAGHHVEGNNTSSDLWALEHLPNSMFREPSGDACNLKRAMDDGVNVRGYVAWSLLDNWEWMFGFEPQFGIVAADRAAQRRTIKPSAAYLGSIARRKFL